MVFVTVEKGEKMIKRFCDKCNKALEADQFKDTTMPFVWWTVVMHGDLPEIKAELCNECFEKWEKTRINNREKESR